MTVFEKWVFDWGISPAALTDLRNRLAQTPVTPGGKGEAVVQQAVRLRACQEGVRLWRNNVGACQDATGRQIRYGLGNDSSKINKHIKSSDLIGITPVTVTPADIGRTLGVFTSIECKHSGWRYSGTERELAQLAWLELVAAMGGIGRFETGVNG